MTLKTAQNTAFTFFGIGTLLFLLALVSRGFMPWAFLGFIFIVFAVIYNLVVVFILLYELIKYDRLESFYGICIILANLPIAVGYLYILDLFSF